jgi:predicted transcriptional regulator
MHGAAEIVITQEDADCPFPRDRLGNAPTEDTTMNPSKPDNRERNARILELARQGKGQAEIARELGISRGVVNGVLRRARDAGTLARTEPPVRSESGQAVDVQQGQGDKEEA